MSFSFDLNDMEFDIPCPKCKKEFAVKGSQLNTDVICPHCSISVFIDGQKFKKQIKSAEKQINNLLNDH